MKTLYRLTAFAICILLIIFSFSACSKSKNNTSSPVLNEFPVTVGGVTLKELPERVAVLSDNIADIILVLGYESVLKAKSADCTQSQLSVLPDVSFEDIEALAELNLDLVLTDSEPKNMGELALSGIPVMVFEEAATRTEFEKLYFDIATALNGAKTGGEFGAKRSKDLFTSVDDIIRELPETNMVITACYLYDIAGEAASGDSYAGFLLESSRLINAFKNNTTGDVSLGTIKMANPQYIFCPIGLKDEIMNASDYSSLKAVKDGKVYEIDETLIRRQGLSVLDAVRFITEIVFSEDEQPQGNNPPVDDPEPTTPPSGFSELKHGDKGDLVKSVQERLYELGYLYTEPTGDFGDMTEHAVKNFQFINNYNPTGIINEPTYNGIFSDNALPMPE